MANIKTVVSKKGLLVGMVILVLILGGGGAYLLYRVNKEDTVAPTDSDASETKYCRRCKPDTCNISRVDGNCTGNDDGEYVGCTNNKGIEMCCKWNDTEEYECGVSAYHITYVAGANGSVTKSGQNSVTPGGSISSTATPKNGYIFEKWNDGKTTATRTDSNVQADATYTATFKVAPADTVTLKYNVSPTGAGKIMSTQNTDITGTTLTLPKGSTAKATATANTGYKFVKWNDGKTDNPRTDVINANTVYTANFEATGTTKYTLQILVSPAGSGKIIDSKGYDVTGKLQDNISPGSPIWTSAVANSGYKFVKWDDGETSNPREGVINSSMVWTAIFEEGIATPIVTPGSDTVPDTAIFDDTKDTIIFGIVILAIGIAWTWIVTLPKKAYKTISEASSEYISSMKEEKQRNVRESRRKRLEKKIK